MAFLGVVDADIARVGRNADRITERLCREVHITADLARIRVQVRCDGAALRVLRGRDVGIVHCRHVQRIATRDRLPAHIAPDIPHIQIHVRDRIGKRDLVVDDVALVLSIPVGEG
jgi:hypothetical protein